MGTLLIIGGARSGKSGVALMEANTLDSSKGKYFLATSPITDEEFSERISRHKEERQGQGWHTIEEETELHRVLATLPLGSVVVIDCLTLWVNNLMYHQGESGITEEQMGKYVENLFEVIGKNRLQVIAVTNEVGMGIVPENSVSRIYRDLVGRCNQVFAALADNVYFVSCGLPIKLK